MIDLLSTNTNASARVGARTNAGMNAGDGARVGSVGLVERLRLAGVSFTAARIVDGGRWLTVTMSRAGETA